MSEERKVTSIVEWQLNPRLVAWADKMFNRPEWKLLIAVMQESEHVRFSGLFDKEESIEPMRQLGRIEGWDQFLKILKLAAEPRHDQSEMPSATFSPPEIEPAQKE